MTLNLLRKKQNVIPPSGAFYWCLSPWEGPGLPCPQSGSLSCSVVSRQQRPLLGCHVRELPTEFNQWEGLTGTGDWIRDTPSLPIYLRWCLLQPQLHPHKPLSFQLLSGDSDLLPIIASHCCWSRGYHSVSFWLLGLLCLGDMKNFCIRFPL